MNLTVEKRYDRSREKMLSEEVKFWETYFNSQEELLSLEELMVQKSMNKRRQKELKRRKDALEKEKIQLLQKRTSVLQGPV